MSERKTMLPPESGPGGYDESVGARRISPVMKSFLLFLIFVAVCLAIHHRGFQSPMIYDSSLWIERKAHIFERKDVKEVISIFPKRPLLMISFYFNHALTGMEPAPFRVFSAALVAASGVALVWLIIVLLRIRGPSSRLSATEELLIAGSLGALFVVHPLQTFALLYIWQRSAILACFFSFTTLSLYLALRSGQVRHTRIACVATGLLFFLGLNCKENVAFVPLIMPAAEVLLLGRVGLSKSCDGPPADSQPWRSWLLGDWVKRLLLIGLITVPPLVVYLLVTPLFHGPESVHEQSFGKTILNYYRTSGITFPQLLGTECRVLFSYLSMILVPFARPLLLIEVQTVSSSLWNPPTTLPAVIGVLTLLTAVPLLAKIRPLAAFGIAFFLVGNAPEGLLVPQYLYFGYRAILPMAGVMIVLADGVAFLLESCRPMPRFGILRPALILLVVAILPALAAVTVSRAAKWNPRAFWSEEYLHLPQPSEQMERVLYVTVLVNLAETLVDSGEYRRGADLLRTARRIYPEAPTIALSLGQVLTKTGDSAEAQELLEGIVRQKPEIPGAWIALSRALMDQGKTKEGVDRLSEAVDRYPKDFSLRLKLAEALADTGKVNESVAQLKIILATDPDNRDAVIQMGFAAKKSGNFTEAMLQFKRALQIDSGSREALMGLLMVEKELAKSGPGRKMPAKSGDQTDK